MVAEHWLQDENQVTKNHGSIEINYPIVDPDQLNNNDYDDCNDEAHLHANVHNDSVHSEDIKDKSSHIQLEDYIDN
eukprot:4829988-Amphidinium_carterae.1